MKNDLFTRACEVIESCNTLEQLEVADRFCSLVIGHWLLPESFPNLYRIYDAQTLVATICRQREDLRIRSIAREEISDALDRLGLLI